MGTGAYASYLADSKRERAEEGRFNERRRGSRVIGLARLSIARPKLSLAVWALVALALGLIGLGVAKSLSPTIVVVPGSESSRAQQLSEARFGPTQLVPILLEGPAAALDRQGPKLVRDLLKRPHTRALTAWDAGAASQGLRPSANAAMIVVSVDKPEGEVVNHDQPQIEALVARDIARPVHPSVTGQPSIDRALKDQAISTTRRSELIALAILFGLLLLGLRAPLAALAVTLVGAATVLAGFGAMALVGKAIAVDPLALALASMTGLALGVGYSLLVLDRFHQQAPPRGGDAPRVALAAADAVSSTGRAVLFAGTGLILALLLASAIAPTKILVSLGVGVLICSALAVGGAVVVMPAALSLLGARIARAGTGAPGTLQRDWDRLVAAGAWVRHKAAIAGLLALLALLLLAVPTFALKTGPPDVSQLPRSDRARIAFEAVGRAMGPGWPTPYNAIVVSPKGPITTAATLQRLDGFQERLAKDPAVASVAGPGALSSETKPLGKLPSALAQSSKLLTGGKRDLGRLSSGLGQAGAGARQLQSGLSEAGAGAGLLHGGSSSAQAGSVKLHAGLAAARSGSAQLSAGLAQALAGANALKAGATQALAGSIDLANGLATAHAPVSSNLPSVEQLTSLAEGTSATIGRLQGDAQSTSSELANALEALRGMTSGKSDPRYAQALGALERASGSAGGVSSGLGGAAGNASEAAKLAKTLSIQEEFLSNLLGTLASGAGKLQSGLAKLRSGNAQLAAGIGKLSGGGGKLTAGLTQLRDGAGALQAGLAQLTGGAGQLQAGLAGGVSPTGQLVNGLGQLQAGVAKFSTTLPSPKDIETLQAQSPGLFNSGYFLLAAVEGAQPAASNAAGFAVNVSRGGNAGQLVIISRYPASDKRTAALGERLKQAIGRFARQNHLSAALGGPAGNLADFTSTTNHRLPIVIAALALAVMLTLGVALRAVALPVVAVLALLLTAAATFGVMQLLFGGGNPPLGGSGYLDPMSIVGIFTVVFGISLIYSVVLLARAREELLAGASADHALDIALRRTAAASTGSGLLMIAALIPFATTELGTVRAFGVAVAIAVTLDTFLVRPVLLPVAVQLLGRFSWWPTRVSVSRQPRKPKASRITGRMPLISRLRHHHP
jgi:putative drug exporter of the RND superfamily